METKKEIRCNSLKKRRELPLTIRREYSRIITDQVVSHPFFHCAEVVYCYVGFREEVDTSGLIQIAWAMGKTVAVPKVIVDHKMEFYKITSMKELTPGYQGILEPTPQPAYRMEVPKGEQALIILPGAAFDREGNRIGYGKGFYDAYLQKASSCRKIGLAFSIQCLERIPAEIHDICVDMVVTEVGDYRKG